MKKLGTILALALVLAIGLTTVAGAESIQGKQISIMTPYLGSVTTNQMVEYLQAGLEAQGATVTVINTDNDFSALASRIEDVVSASTDAIVLVSADPSQIANQLQNAFDANIPVFGCDSGFIEGMQVNATSDNYQMGELIVRYLFETLMGGKGTVIALTHRPHPGVVKRCEAFDKLLTEFPDIKLITEQHTLPARAVAAAALIGRHRLSGYESFIALLHKDDVAVHYLPDILRHERYEVYYRKYLTLYPLIRTWYDT